MTYESWKQHTVIVYSTLCSFKPGVFVNNGKIFTFEASYWKMKGFKIQNRGRGACEHKSRGAEEREGVRSGWQQSRSCGHTLAVHRGNGSSATVQQHLLRGVLLSSSGQTHPAQTVLCVSQEQSSSTAGKSFLNNYSTWSPS